ncbi:unnamed protein product [Paramecium octaurelia]|uniref:Uncharacterized protein n=1 Tax=Paramecium octaurelia TaxID=43137 RepID=A0A8S1UTX8_PAROT|nr:unnamed protein product [Paramecium octaurelia]
MACLNTQYEEIKLALLNMVCEYKQFSNQMINRQHEKVKKAETILRNNRIKWLRRYMPEIKNQYILIPESLNRQNEPLQKQKTCTDQTTQNDNDGNAQIYGTILQEIENFLVAQHFSLIPTQEQINSNRCIQLKQIIQGETLHLLFFNINLSIMKNIQLKEALLAIDETIKNTLVIQEIMNQNAELIIDANVLLWFCKSQISTIHEPAYGGTRICRKSNSK